MSIKDAFIYEIPTKVYFGESQLGQLGNELAVYGKRYCLFTAAVQ